MSMTWVPANAIPAFAAKAINNVRALQALVMDEIHLAVTEGSAITGSPGSLVGEYGPDYYPKMVEHAGTLRDAWEKVVKGEWDHSVLNKEEYAQFIEEGHYKQHSSVGRAGSMMMVKAEWVPLVDHFAAEVNK